MSAALTPETVTAGVPVPMTVDSPARYRPGQRVLACGLLISSCPIEFFGPATEPPFLSR
jgi:hypothetical protein